MKLNEIFEKLGNPYLILGVHKSGNVAAIRRHDGKVILFNSPSESALARLGLTRDDICETSRLAGTGDVTEDKEIEDEVFYNSCIGLPAFMNDCFFSEDEETNDEDEEEDE